MRGLITFVLTAMFVFIPIPITSSPYLLAPLVLFAFYRTYSDLNTEHPDTKRYRDWLERRFPKEATGLDTASIAAGALQPTGAGFCPVCHGRMTVPRSCPSCATPHHVDCWQYNGGCGMYGCGGGR